MTELITALNEKRLLEVFGSGTACVVSPVDTINYLGKDYKIPTMKQNDSLNLAFLKEITNIQYGKVKHPWAVYLDED